MSDQNTILPDILTNETKIFILSTVKIAFFAILEPTWTHILALKGPNREFLERILIFNPL